MNHEVIYNDLIQELNLGGLAKEDRDAILMSLAKSVHKEFLLDVLHILGDEKFQALEASVAMGNEFYETSLKHLLPNYEEVFIAARERIINAFKEGAASSE